MTKIIFGSSFARSLKKILSSNPELRKTVTDKLEVFRNNPYDPSLRTHKLKGKLSAYRSFSIKVDSNTSALTEYLSKPFTRKKQLNFTFTSALAATDTAQSFPATMKTRVRYKGIDSIYSNNFTIFLPAAPTSGVRSQANGDISFTINPNPLSKQATFVVTTSTSEPATLEIYDILGNRKFVIAGGELIEGSRAFHFDAGGFPSGSYCARLVCEGKVVSKLLIIN